MSGPICQHTSFTAASATSRTSSSWTCMMSLGSMPLWAFQWSTLIIARLMISAAVPCIGALMAVRSAYCRRLALRELISGRYKRRLNTVSTYPWVHIIGLTLIDNDKRQAHGLNDRVQRLDLST